MAGFLDQVLGDTQVDAPPAGTPTPDAPAVDIAADTPADSPPVEAPQDIPPAAEPVADKGPGMVPIAAMLDWRDKAQAAERRAEDLERQRQPANIPDPFDDPQGFAAHQRQELQQALFAERFATSEYLATEKFGEADVKSAAEWAEGKAKADPTFAQRFSQERFPMMWIVQQHKRDAMLADIGDNVDDWFTREAAKRGYALQSAAPAASVQTVAASPASKPAMPPRSIASDASPAASAPVNGNPMAGMDAIFSGR